MYPFEGNYLKFLIKEEGKGGAIFKDILQVFFLKGYIRGKNKHKRVGKLYYLGG